MFDRWEVAVGAGGIPKEKKEKKRNTSIIYALLIFMHFASILGCFFVLSFYLSCFLSALHLFSLLHFVCHSIPWQWEWLCTNVALMKGIYIRPGSCRRSISFAQVQIHIYSFQPSVCVCVSHSSGRFLRKIYRQLVFVTIFWCSLIATLMSTVTLYEETAPVFMLFGLNTHGHAHAFASPPSPAYLLFLALTQFRSRSRARFWSLYRSPVHLVLAKAHELSEFVSSAVIFFFIP